MGASPTRQLSLRAGRLNWGFNADWDLVPDLPLFTDAIRASFNELRDAAAAEPSAATPSS